MPELPPAVTFSIVTAAYDAAGTIGAAITSLLRQTRSDFEMIVIDDGSTDGTADIVRAHTDDPRISVHTQPNAGPSAARNRGIELSRGRYIAFLDSDDLAMPRYLELMAKALESDDRNGMAFTDGWSLDDETRKIHNLSAMSGSKPPDDPPKDPEELLRLLLWKNFMHSSGMVRRDVLDEVGGYDESMRYAEDYELWLRIVTAGYLAARGPGRLVIARDREDSLSKDHEEMLVSLRDLLIRFADRDDISRETAEYARERSAYWAGQLAQHNGENHRRSAVRRVRAVGHSVKQALGLGRHPLKSTPPEIKAAFPDLERI